MSGEGGGGGGLLHVSGGKWGAALLCREGERTSLEWGGRGSCSCHHRRRWACIVYLYRAPPPFSALLHFPHTQARELQKLLGMAPPEQRRQMLRDRLLQQLQVGEDGSAGDVPLSYPILRSCHSCEP